MAIHQLRDFYEYVGMDFSTEPADLAALKKILQLQLKASPDGHLTIKGTTYTKNDIFKILEEDYNEDAFDIYTVLKDFPDALLLLNPSSIDRYFLFTDRRIIQLDEWEEIQDFFSEHHFMDFYSSLLKDMLALDMKRLNWKLSYLMFFYEHLQEKCTKALRESLLRQLRLLNSESDYSFAKTHDYYNVVKSICKHDYQFLIDQYNAIHHNLFRQDRGFKAYFFEHQLSLPFDFIMKRKIENEFSLFELEGIRTGKLTPVQQKEAKSEGIKLVVFIAAVIAILVMIGAFSDSGSSDKHDIRIPNFDFKPYKPVDIPDFDAIQNLKRISDSLKTKYNSDYPTYNNYSTTDYSEKYKKRLDSIMAKYRENQKEIMTRHQRNTDSIMAEFQRKSDSIMNSFTPISFDEKDDSDSTEK